MGLRGRFFFHNASRSSFLTGHLVTRIVLKRTKLGVNQNRPRRYHIFMSTVCKRPNRVLEMVQERPHRDCGRLDGRFGQQRRIGRMTRSWFKPEKHGAKYDQTISVCLVRCGDPGRGGKWMPDSAWRWRGHRKGRREDSREYAALNAGRVTSVECREGAGIGTRRSHSGLGAGIAKRNASRTRSLAPLKRIVLPK